MDEVRINQIYEQAKWQILTEEVECTEEEAITFGALQFQVKAASQSPQSTQGADEVDDIDAALNDLQVSLKIVIKSNCYYGNCYYRARLCITFLHCIYH